MYVAMCIYVYMQVPLGILLKSESSYEEMVDIMESLHEYVPTYTTTSRVTVPGGEEVTVTNDHFYETIFGGDYLTAARARGCQRIRKNSERGKERLQGLKPVCEDWHSKLCVLGVRSSYNNI